MDRRLPPDRLPITREFLDDLTAEAQLIVDELGRLDDRRRDRRLELRQLRREIRRAERRLEASVPASVLKLDTDEQETRRS